MRVLGIETSCDETGLAIYDGEKGIVDHALYSQIQLHAEYGGVVPELAARDHLHKLLPMVEDFLNKKEHIDAIAYTAGPGLSGPLRIGASVAHTLAWRLGKPLFPVHHLEAHLMVAFLDRAESIPFPFIGLLVSGGHTLLLRAEALGQYELLGETLDDAAGEAFDKAAKRLGLAYPGGAQLSKLAQQSLLRKRFLPLPYPQGLDFSFSGLKTAFGLKVDQLTSQAQAADLAYALERSIIETLCKKTFKCMEKEKLFRLVAAGGVVSNESLTEALKQTVAKLKGEFITPVKELRSDNGVMVAFTGWLYLTSNRAVARRGCSCVQIFPRWPFSDYKDWQKRSISE